MAFRRRRIFGPRRRRFRRGRSIIRRRRRPRRLFRRARLRRERKYIDDSAQYNVTSLAGIEGMTNIAQGDNEHQRIGRQIQCNGLSIRGFVRINATTPVDLRMRMLVIRDLRNAPGLTPLTRGDILSTGVDTMTAPYRITTNPSFRILKDHTFNIVPAIRPEILFKWWIPLRHIVKFTDDTASSQISGDVYMMFWSDQDDADKRPSFGFFRRLRFYDD